eukprot:COSAG04_NODE_22_length_37957_cov_250.276930_7_plen_110_part_00
MRASACSVSAIFFCTADSSCSRCFSSMLSTRSREDSTKSSGWPARGERASIAAARGPGGRAGPVRCFWSDRGHCSDWPALPGAILASKSFDETLEKKKKSPGGNLANVL